MKLYVRPLIIFAIFSSVACDRFYTGTKTLPSFSNATASKVAVDPSGNVVTAAIADGYFKITKYNSQLTAQFTLTDELQSNLQLAVDSSGNILVAGNLKTGLSLRKYASDGHLLFEITDDFGVTLSGAAATQLAGIAVDSTDAIYVGGSTTQALHGQLMKGRTDLFISKYSSAGVHQWTIQDGNSAADVIPAGITLAGSEIFIFGNIRGQLSGQTGHGDSDLFVEKRDLSGALLVTVQDGGVSDFFTAAHSYPCALAVDGGGNFYLTGFTSAGLQGNTQIGSDDLFLIKYDSMGTVQFAIQDGAAPLGVVRPNGISIDASGNAYVSGLIYESALAGAFHGSKYGSIDLFLAKYDATGAYDDIFIKGEAGVVTSCGPVLMYGAELYLTGDKSIPVRKFSLSLVPQ